MNINRRKWFRVTGLGAAALALPKWLEKLGDAKVIEEVPVPKSKLDDLFISKEAAEDIRNWNRNDDIITQKYGDKVEIKGELLHSDEECSQFLWNIRDGLPHQKKFEIELLMEDGTMHTYNVNGAYLNGEYKLPQNDFVSFGFTHKHGLGEKPIQIKAWSSEIT